MEAAEQTEIPNKDQNVMKHSKSTSQQNVGFLAVTVACLWLLSAAAFLPDWGHPVLVKYYADVYGVQIASE